MRDLFSARATVFTVPPGRPFLQALAEANFELHLRTLRRFLKSKECRSFGQVEASPEGEPHHLHDARQLVPEPELVEQGRKLIQPQRPRMMQGDALAAMLAAANDFREERPQAGEFLHRRFHDHSQPGRKRGDLVRLKFVVNL